MHGIIFTGAPGAGKTAVLHALRDQGYAVVEDTARTIVRQRRQAGLSPRPSPSGFAEDVLRADIENYRRWVGASEYVFFDRGVLDALCMLDLVARLPVREADAFVERYPYAKQVFSFPPWEAIYTDDAERDQTFADAVQVHATAVQWYRRCNYDVVEVPKLPVSDRCAFILDRLGRDVL